MFLHNKSLDTLMLALQQQHVDYPSSLTRLFNKLKYSLLTKPLHTC